MPVTPAVANEAPVVKTVGTTVSYTSTTTLATVADLSVNLGGTSSAVADLEYGKKYWIRGVLEVDGATAGDIKLQFSLPSGTTVLAAVVGAEAGATTSGDIAHVLQQGSAANTLGTAGSGTSTGVLVEGVLTCGTTQGAVALQAAQGTSSGTASKIFAGSTLVYQRLN